MAQKELSDFDVKLKKECQKIEDAMFDRENRLALLKSGNFKVPSNSILSALFAEARRQQDGHGRKTKRCCVLTHLVKKKGE